MTQTRSLWIQRALFLLVLCLFAKPLLIFGRPFLFVCVSITALVTLFYQHLPDPGQEQPTAPWALWGGLLIVVSALIVLEILEPHYFFRADNKVMFFPVMAFSAKSFFEGVFPTWNPYQYLGEPLAGSSFFGLTYPIVYIAYGIAHAVLKEDLLFFNVFAWIHILAGYFAMAHLMKREFAVTGWMMSLSAATFALGGFGLICGRDWYYITPLTFWLPLTFMAFARWVRKPGSQSGFILGAAIALMLHAGNIQMWFYWVLLLSIGTCVMILGGDFKRSNGLSALVALAAFTVIASPALIPQLLYSASSNYPAGASEGILHRLNALLLPYPFVNLPHPLNLGYSPHSWTPFYFVGYVSLLAAIAQVSVYAINLWRGPSKSTLTKQLPSQLATQLVWMLVIAFGFSLGAAAPFWSIFQYIPVVNLFKRAFKFQAYLSFLVPLIGALFLSRLKFAIPIRHRTWSLGLISFTFLMGLALHIPFARATYDYFQTGNFPTLPPFLKIEKSDRIVSVSPIQPVSEGYFETLPHNLPTAYRIFSMEGDDILTQTHGESQIPQGLWRDYGVRWALVSRDRERDGAAFLKIGAKKRYSNATTDVYEIPNPEPIAKLVGGNEPQRFTTRANGVVVELARPITTPATLQLNFLWRKAMRAWVDDRPMAIEKDSLKRMLIPLPQGAQAIRVEYYPLFRWGHALEGLLLILIVMISFALFDGTQLSFPIWRITKHAEQLS